MRSIAKKLNIPAPAQPPEGRKQREDVFSLKLETPMYGGGAKIKADNEEGEEKRRIVRLPDKEFPVRVPSVRGNLRFWWRMLFAGGKKGKALRDAESAIWGSTERASNVKITVSDCKGFDLRYYDNMGSQGRYAPFGFGPFDAEAYALFPAEPRIQRGAIAEPGHDIVREGMDFTLRLSYSDGISDNAVQEVRSAMAAWIYFGGLGSRTRRGLGTLSCEKAELSGGGKLPGLKEVLAQNTDITLWTREPRKTGALDAWHDALDMYRQYRQQRNPGQQRNRPGRSHWPEPDSIRQLTGRSAHEHSTLITEPLPAFPRAALGLPIIFHFIGGGEPRDVQLKGTPAGAKDAVERMASPVITKALFDGVKWRSAVVILPRKDALSVTPAPDTRNTEGIIGVRDSRYIKAHYQPTRGADNAITGFENFIKNQGFKKEA